jgi:hypothetical protein
MSEWSEWFVYRIDGPPTGPMSTKAVAEGILAGRLPPDCWVAAPGGSRWLRATDVPVIASFIEDVSTRRRPTAMAVTAVMEPLPKLPPKMDETISMIHPPELPPTTIRSTNEPDRDAFSRPPPPSSPTLPSYRHDEAPAPPSADVPRKSSLGE